MATVKAQRYITKTTAITMTIISCITRADNKKKNNEIVSTMIIL